MYFLQHISQWGERSQDKDKLLEPRKQSVLSASSTPCTNSNILISFPYLWQAFWVTQRNHCLLPTLTKFGSKEKKRGKKRRAGIQSSLPFYPSNPITCQTALKKSIREEYILYLLWKTSGDLIYLSVQTQSSIVFFPASTRRLHAALKSFHMGRVTSLCRIYTSNWSSWINWNNMKKGHGSIYWILRALS